MRKLAIFAFAFSAAIFISQYFLNSTAVLLLAAASAITAFVFLCIRRPPSSFIKLAAFGLMTGFIWNFCYDQAVIQPAEALSGTTGSFEAVADSYPEKTDNGYKIRIKLLADSVIHPKAIMYCSDKYCSNITPGDVLLIEGTLKSAAELTDSDYFGTRGINLFLYAGSVPAAERRIALADIRYFHCTAALSIKNKISEVFPSDKAPFIIAILTGDRALFNENTYFASVLSSVGCSHIIAVSGMHVAFLVSLLRIFIGRRRFGSLLCIPAILLLMAVTGFTPSVVRAGIMQIIILGAAVLRREYDEITALSIALLLLLAINPVSVKNGGLQLSFAATLGLILTGNRLYSFFSGPFSEGRPLLRLYKNIISRTIVNFIIGSAASSLGALFLTVPVSAVMFGKVSLVAPLANILILWAAAGTFFAGIICVAVGFIFVPAGVFLASIVSILVSYIELIASLLSSIPFASVCTDSFYIRVWLLVLYAEIALVYFFPSVRGRASVFIGANLIVLAAAVFLTVRESRAGSLNISVLDVGQGQCIIAESKGSTLVIDCGGNLSENSGDIAADYLSRMGETVIDAFILTHFHSDHANGAIELMRRIETRLLIVPDVEDEESADNRSMILSFAQERGIQIIEISDCEIIEDFGKAYCHIIPPLGTDSVNERGLTIVCTSGSFDMLVTGDMNRTTEYYLLDEYILPDVELLICGHHGSKYSSSEQLLNAVSPETVVISVGKNRYGHPDADTVERLESCGAEVYRTDLCGTVCISLAG